MKDMTSNEMRHFLLDTPRTAKLALVRKGERPHVTPIWFDLDGDVLVFTTWHESVKYHALQHNPRVSICVDDDRPPFAYVIIEGTAEITDPADKLYWATRIASRYMGEALGESFGKRNGVPGEYIVRVTPTKIMAKTGISD